MRKSDLDKLGPFDCTVTRDHALIERREGVLQMAEKEDPRSEQGLPPSAGDTSRMWQLLQEGRKVREEVRKEFAPLVEVDESRLRLLLR